MKSPKVGLRFAVAAAAMLAVAACSSTDETASTPATSVDSGAAQSSVTPGTQEDLVTNVGDRVFFETDKSTLDGEARATLQRQAAWMKTYENLAFTIEGHADERGTREYNLGLGSRRANAVKDYLVSLGVPASRLKTISYGKERPVCLDSTETCWAQNRRAVTVVTSGATS